MRLRLASLLRRWANQLDPPKKTWRRLPVWSTGANTSTYPVKTVLFDYTQRDQ